MTEHRESSPVEPGDGGEGRPGPRRGFARLVESPAARRLALPRLAVAAALAVATVAAVGAVALEAARSAGRWVASREEYAIPFGQIELDPAPGPWIEGGKARILEQVRVEAKHGRTVPALELDLKAFRNDFQRCPWVRRVHRVDRGYGRLAVRLDYRKPVAVVVIPIPEPEGPTGFVIDEEGVPFPAGDIVWVSKRPRYRVLGIDAPLIEIRGITSPATPRFGVPWKRPDAAETLDGLDLRVLGAARLAEFLQRQAKTSPGGKELPDFVSIWLSEKSTDLLLLDAGSNQLAWGRAPGEEKPGDPSAAEKWKMLLEWVDRQGPLDARGPDYYRFGRSGLERVAGRRPRVRPGGD